MVPQVKKIAEFSTMDSYNYMDTYYLYFQNFQEKGEILLLGTRSLLHGKMREDDMAGKADKDSMSF